MADGIKIIGLIINTRKNIMTIIIKISLGSIIIVIDTNEVQAIEEEIIINIIKSLTINMDN